MRSRITIEVDFDNANQPVLQILQRESSDVRDGLLKQFAQQFGGSSWCNIRFDTTNYDPQDPDRVKRIFITPVRPEQFKEQANIMLEQHRVNEEFAKKQE